MHFSCSCDIVLVKYSFFSTCSVFVIKVQYNEIFRLFKLWTPKKWCVRKTYFVVNASWSLKWLSCVLGGAPPYDISRWGRERDWVQLCFSFENKITMNSKVIYGTFNVKWVTGKKYNNNKTLCLCISLQHFRETDTVDLFSKYIL